MLENFAEIPNWKEKTTLKFYDQSTRLVYTTQELFPYPAGELIISRTDERGFITYINEAFVNLSGYSESELIGQPHYIIRHPDTPKSAFLEMWQTVTNGRKWHGYIKNLRRDGSHYWVYATVAPLIRKGNITGYVSVRREPSQNKIDYYEKLYAEIRKKENGGK